MVMATSLPFPIGLLQFVATLPIMCYIPYHMKWHVENWLKLLLLKSNVVFKHSCSCKSESATYKMGPVVHDIM